MTSRPRAIVTAPLHWTSAIQVGTHEIARTLARAGWDVAYLSDPITPFHVARFARPDVQARWRLYRGGGVVDEGGRVTAWLPMTFISPRTPMIHALDGFSAGWLTRSGRQVSAWLKRHGFADPDLLWIDSVIWDRLPALVHARRSVLRVADAGSGFPRHRAVFDAMEERLAKRVDLVVYTAPTLRDHLVQLGPRALEQMPNGVDASRFAASTIEPADLRGLPRPRAVYVGAIDDWFDFDLVANLAQMLPSVSFTLIGPDHVARRRLPVLQNLHLLGSRPRDAIPGYLQHSDVGLIPFDVRGYPELVNSVQPLKLYEYVASGLPVVAARWAELERLGSPAALYDTPTEAAAEIERAIQSPRTPQTGRDWVKGADWPARLEPVLRSLGLPGVLRASDA